MYVIYEFRSREELDGSIDDGYIKSVIGKLFIFELGGRKNGEWGMDTCSITRHLLGSAD